MPTTGVDFNRKFDIATDYAYTGYWDNAKRNEIIKKATIEWIDALFSKNDRQSIRDCLYGLTSTAQNIVCANNAVNLYSFLQTYAHILQVKTYFRQSLSCVVSGASNTTPIKLSVLGTNNIRTGEQIFISGVTGNSAVNGYRFVEMVNNRQFLLYSDAALTTPVPGTGTYITGGLITRIVSAWAQDYDQKTSPLDEPDIYNPKFEIADQALKLYPSNVVCESIDLDFVRRPTTYIDVTDNTDDLEAIYSLRMIEELVEKAKNIAAGDNLDVGEMQVSQQALMQP